jgi:hypothetical protein
LDNPYTSEQVDRVTKIYKDNDLDLLVHRTGNGIHFLSPTMIPKLMWKELMSTVKDLNPKCPMTTLRVEPNKYPNESEAWYRCEVGYGAKPVFNNLSVCMYLNRVFGSEFKGIATGEIKLVRYPLPL